jgi:hypothetical protein
MTYSAKIDLNKGFIDISEDLYDEDSENQEDGGKGDFSQDDLSALKRKFSKN